MEALLLALRVVWSRMAKGPALCKHLSSVGRLTISDRKFCEDRSLAILSLLCLGCYWLEKVLVGKG